jgi:hypothetical protein
MLAHASGRPASAAVTVGLTVGLSYLVLLQSLYYLTILRATSEVRLQKAQQ